MYIVVENILINVSKLMVFLCTNEIKIEYILKKFEIHNRKLLI